MELLTVKEAADRAGVSTKAIYYSLKEGKLTAYRQYGRVLVSASDLATYQPRSGNGRTNLTSPSSETHRLAAESTRHIWDTPEEDVAWAYLQEATSS